MKRTWNHYLLAAVILATACVPAERHHDRITRTWPADGIKRLDLHEVDGSVDIEGTNNNEISLIADVRERGFHSDPNKENKGYFESRVEGDTLSIGRHGDRHIHIGWFSRKSIYVDYVIRVPKSVALEVRTVNGRVKCRFLQAFQGASLKTVNGSVDAELPPNASFACDLSQVNGDFEASFAMSSTSGETLSRHCRKTSL